MPKSQESDHYILFELAGATYALPSQAVQHMEMVEQITPVPNALPYVAGVIFSRGAVLPLIDLRTRFGFPRVGYSLRSRIVAVRSGERTLGLIVDSAREFVRIAAAQIQPPPEAISGLSGAYLRGIARLDERLVLMLDLEEVLHGTEEIDEPGPA